MKVLRAKVKGAANNMGAKSLTVGTNFDINQLQFFIACNQTAGEVRVESVYGSLRSSEIDLN